MKNIRVYRNADNINFIVLCSLNEKKTEFAVLNLLDEDFADNSLIQLPSIQKWSLQQFSHPKLRGSIPFHHFSTLFGSAYHRTMEMSKDNFEMQVVLDCSQLAFDVYVIANQDQSLV